MFPLLAYPFPVQSHKRDIILVPQLLGKVPILKKKLVPLVLIPEEVVPIGSPIRDFILVGP